MKRACIDTHVLVWYLSRPTRLAAGARRLLRRADAGRTEILIPAICVIELGLLQEAGRRVPGAAQVEALCAAQPAFRVAALDLPVALEFVLLSALSDPFDRMVVATTRICEAPLVTADTGIQDSALVTTVWE